MNLKWLFNDKIDKPKIAIDSSAKLCINCKHCIKSSISPKFSFCEISPKQTEQSYINVTGELQTFTNEEKYHFCSTIRRSQVEGDCGEAGIHFQSK